ncbi:MAG: MFS transporter [Thermoplasmata archaeon]|nr:MFS transporter [Thermoplasmata archaeon]
MSGSLTPVAQLVPPSSPVGGRGGFRRTAYVLALTAFVAGIPTPLYAGYARSFHFSSGTLGLVFGSYAVGVLATQFFVAPQASRFGRRPLLGLGMLLAAAASLAFVEATSVQWLVLARVISGLAVGASTSVATAAMSDLEPYRDQHHVARVSVGANFGGFAIGVLLSGLLATWLPEFPHLVFYFAIIGCGTGFWALLGTEETLEPTPGHPRPWIQRISVPADIRSPFWMAAGGVAACYSIYGLFGALVPSYLRESLGISSPAIIGAAVAAMFGIAALSQLATAQVRDRRALLLGFPVMIVALVALAAVLFVSSWVVLLVITAVLGVSVGLTFMGSVTLIDRLAPESERDELLAGFYVAGYLSVAVPTIGVAEASEWIGFTSAGIIFASLLVVAVGFLCVRTYQTSTPPGGGGRVRSAGP